MDTIVKIQHQDQTITFRRTGEKPFRKWYLTSIVENAHGGVAKQVELVGAVTTANPVLVPHLDEIARELFPDA